LPIITLTTDWSANDFYHAAIKGRILSLCPGTTIIDIATGLQPGNKIQAGFILKNCFRDFPGNTIHIIGISPGAEKNIQPVIVKAAGQFFISWDNGILSLIIQDNEVEKIIRVTGFKESTFSELDTFVMLACRLANGETPEILGTSAGKIKKEISLSPAFDKSSITGNILYFDSYGNGITNISRDIFVQIALDRDFSIYFHGGKRINQIIRHYHEAENDEPLAIFNSLGLLELAIKNSNFKSTFGLDSKSLIRISFYDKIDIISNE